MPILVGQTFVAKSGKRLTHLAGTEGLFSHLLGLLHYFLNREFLVAVLQMGNRDEQVALTVRCPRPSSCKEISVELVNNAIDRDTRFLCGGGVL